MDVRLSHLLFAAWIAFGINHNAFAQNFPTKPVRLIVPFPAGGGSDVIGRIIAQKLAERLGQQVVVDNRGGAGGSIGTEAAVRSAPDGYTIVLASTSEIAINPWLYSKLSYDTMKDLTPVTLVAVTAQVIVVHPSLPVKTVKDLIALARARPAEINVVSAGVGTISHLSSELFRSMTNVNWTHVPYKGAAPSMLALVSGEVQVTFASLPAAMALIKSNRIRPIAVSTPTRAAPLPEVPTVMESGVPGYRVDGWYGIFAPAATPKDLIARLSDETAQSLKTPDVINNLANQGAAPGNLTQSQFAEYVKAETAKWGKVVKDSAQKRIDHVNVPHYLDSIMHPRTIALVGVSSDTSTRGCGLIQSLVSDNYEGEIIPVNPNEREVLGFKCYRALADVPQRIDLAIICTSAKTVPGVLEECGKKGVKGAVLLAPGYSETGEQGRLLEQETAAIGRKYNVRLIGADTNGLLTARLGCNASGWPQMPRGPLAILSNSASVLRSLMTEVRFHGHTGINAMLSVGNQIDILFHEYLECFADDPETRAVICYVESFKNAPAYMAVARKVSPVKPVVMYAAGRSAEGRKAAASHSGSMAGDYAVTHGLLRQSGVVVVKQSDHLLPVAEALTLFPPMRGRRVALLSEGGGPITIAAEALAERGLVLAPLTSETQRKIHAIVPNAWAISNPVDAGGGTDPRIEYYAELVKTVLADPNTDALLCVGYFGGYMTAPSRYGEFAAEIEQAACREFGETMRKHRKPIMVQSYYAHLKTQSLDVLRKAGVPFQRHIEVAAQCLASAADYYAAKTRLASASAPAVGSKVTNAARIVAMAAEARRDLLEPEARDLLKACDIAMPPHMLIEDANDIEAVVRAFGDTPLAMKVVSKDIVHKSEAGGVRLGLSGAAALREAFQDIQRSVRIHTPGADRAGMLVTPMVKRGTEVIVGVTRDPQYGRVIMFGLGGVFVEVIGDVIFRALPLTAEDAQEMIGELRYNAVLDGVRGAERVDRKALADLLLRVSRIAMLHPEIAEIDLNPVVAHADGYSIVDARMLLAN